MLIIKFQSRSSRSCDSISTTCGHDAMLAIERRLGGSQFGWVQPIVCDREDVIVIGHLRLAAAHFVGLTEVPVHVASNLSPAQIKALRIADNRTHEESDWIEDLLSAALLDLKSLDFDLGLTGFDSREISALIDQPNSAEDEVPPLPAVPVSRLGDLWLLGPHRVLCADSTNANSVARLMGEYGYGGCAFGVVLHELLTGTQACRGETVSDALASVFTMGRRKQ
jgi:hypothetical protein